MADICRTSLILVSALAAACAGRNYGQSPHPPNPYAVYLVDYGAKCDGISDDSEAYAAAQRTAQASGKTLAVPPGRTCVIKSSWVEYSRITGLEDGSAIITDSEGFAPRIGY